MVTFAALFLKHGFEDMHYWAMEEASVGNSPASLCSLFAVILHDLV